VSCWAGFWKLMIGIVFWAWPLVVIVDNLHGAPGWIPWNRRGVGVDRGRRGGLDIDQEPQAISGGQTMTDYTSTYKEGLRRPPGQGWSHRWRSEFGPSALREACQMDQIVKWIEAVLLTRSDAGATLRGW
jgi:hypothetical protein